MGNKRSKKPKRIPVNLLLKRWEKYGITKEELILLINEKVFPFFIDEPDGLIVWTPTLPDDYDLGNRKVELSKLEKSEEEILRSLRSFEFQRKPEEANGSEEGAVDDDKIEDIEDVEKTESTYADFDQAVLELTKEDPDMPKTDIAEELKHLYPREVQDDTIRRRVMKIQKEHGLFKIEQPGVKKRT